MEEQGNDKKRRKKKQDRKRQQSSNAARHKSCISYPTQQQQQQQHHIYIDTYLLATAFFSLCLVPFRLESVPPSPNKKRVEEPPCGHARNDRKKKAKDKKKGPVVGFMTKRNRKKKCENKILFLVLVDGPTFLCCRCVALTRNRRMFFFLNLFIFGK